jgi:HEAT repeat protein/lysophospholipase L1-like esterase
MTRLRGLAVNLAVATLSALVFAGALEGVCRLLEDPRPAAAPTAAYITEWMEGGDAFFTVKSTAVGWPPWEDYNHDGVRDRELALEKPAGTRRVVCLGDSVTLGYGIAPREAYPQVLQDILTAQDLPVEVFNLALGGWTTRQELIAYRRLARKYRPDQVLLGICLNDIPEMENNLTRPSPLLMAAHRRSALVRRVVGAHDREIHSVEELFTHADSAKVQNAYRRVFADIEALRAETTADGATLAVLVFPFRFQVTPDAPPPVAQETITAFCRERGIPVLDLLPALRAKGPDAYHDYDHFSATGARVVAETVATSGLIEGASAEGAGPAPAESTVPALLAALQDARPTVRARSAWALGQKGSEARAARGALIPLLNDADPGVRWRASEAVAALGVDRESCLSPLSEVLQQRTSPGRAQAARLLGRLGGEARIVVPLLVDALLDPREEVRSQAAVALGAVGPAARSAIPALVAAFGDATIRWQVADALATVGPDAPEAQAALTRGLSDPSSSVRWRSASALDAAQTLPPDTVAALAAAAARDPSENVRLAALKALAASLRSPDAIVLGALRDPDARIRIKAIDIVSRLGTSEAIAALEPLAADPEPEVRDAALRVLRKLKRKA